MAPGRILGDTDHVNGQGGTGARAMSVELRQRTARAVTAAEGLRDRAARTVMVSVALQAEFEARRRAVERPVDELPLAPVAHDIVGFRLAGYLDGRTVTASWHADDAHQIRADEALLTRAWLLADLEHVVADDGTPRIATVSGPPHAVFLTLLQAFDEVVKADVDLPVPED